MNANEQMQRDLEILKQNTADLETALNLLPDLGEIRGFLTVICFQAFIPYNLETAKEISAKLADAGWVERGRYNREHAGDAVIWFAHPDAKRSFEIVMQPELAGATCKKQVIDYVKQPVYEIVCLEAQHGNR